MNRADTALSCFADCFNCSQAVLSAYAGHWGLDGQSALRLASGSDAGAFRPGTCVCHRRRNGPSYREHCSRHRDEFGPKNRVQAGRADSSLVEAFWGVLRHESCPKYTRKSPKKSTQAQLAKLSARA